MEALEEKIKKIQLPFFSTIWYGNPQNILVEGKISGKETQIVLQKTKDYKESDLEEIKEYIWEININNKYIQTNKLCYVNALNKYSINEFVQAIDQYLSHVDVIRVFKSPFPTIYYIYLEFDSLEFCNVFYNTYSYAKIIPVENDYMIFAEVESISFEEVDANIPLSVKKNKSEELSTSSVDDTNVCTICMECLDKKSNNQPNNVNNSAGGVVYVLCGHAFHIECFKKYNDDRCPLCRYNLSPPNISTCRMCSSEKDLWMCLVCGYISCGDEGGSSNHRFEHYKATGHVYAQGIGEKHKIIFDFLKNAPVHIWIHNSILNSLDEDTKIDIPVDSEKAPSFKNPKEKVEYIMSEYNSIISSELEKQRAYYLGEIRKIESKYLTAQKNFDLGFFEKKEELKKAEENLRMTEGKKKELFDKIKEKNSEISALNEEVKKSEDAYNMLLKEKEGFEELNNLQTEDLDKLIEKEEEEIKELSEEINDMKTHIKTSNDIEKRGDMNEYKDASLGILLDCGESRKKHHHHKAKK